MPNEKTKRAVKIRPSGSKIPYVDADGDDGDFTAVTVENLEQQAVRLEQDNEVIAMLPPHARAVAAAMLKVCDEIEGGAA